MKWFDAITGIVLMCVMYALGADDIPIIITGMEFGLLAIFEAADEIRDELRKEGK